MSWLRCKPLMLCLITFVSFWCRQWWVNKIVSGPQFFPLLPVLQFICSLVFVWESRFWLTVQRVTTFIPQGSFGHKNMLRPQTFCTGRHEFLKKPCLTAGILLLCELWSSCTWRSWTTETEEKFVLHLFGSFDMMLLVVKDKTTQQKNSVYTWISKE